MKKKLLINNIISIIYQIVSVLIGLFLPRLYLQVYGSDVNGLVSSISQMLSIISMLDFGVGAVVQSALYKPLSQKNYDQISDIYSAAKNYFNQIAKILVIYICILFFYYGLVKDTGFSFLYTISLIFSISISTFAQYYFGMCNNLLLNADQKIYITSLISLITIVINAVIVAILIEFGLGIQVVKLFSSLIFVCKPLLYSLYVRKNYKITVKKNVSRDVLKQKWHGLAQHLSSVVTNSTDYAVLTVFSNLKSLSIYNIYVMPLNSIRTLMETVSTSYKSYFGKLYVERKMKILKKEFRRYELTIHFTTVIIFGCIVRVLVPFVLLYTKGVNDANYENYLFSYIITAAYAIYALRIPYTSLIVSAGHFKQTQFYCIVESILNVVISIVGVLKYDLIGVGIGTCIAVGYRLVSSAYYLSKNIIERNFVVFFKTACIDILAILVIILFTYPLKIVEVTLVGWIKYSLLIFFICFFVTSIIYIIFYKRSLNISPIISRRKNNK